MSGKPVSRIGDVVVKGKIVTGTATVLIGDAAEGLADQCSTCEPTVGGPVNPILGTKLLPAETDFALAAPQPFAFTRSYLSRDARIGVLGQGWSIAGAGLGLEVSDEATVLIDAQGRRSRFGPLLPGEARFSATERLWIRRGGPVIPQTDALAPWLGRWAAVPEDVRHDPACIFIATGGVFHQFRYATGQWKLSARFDRNGYRTDFVWAALANGQRVPVRVTDSAGRHYGFTYGAVSPTAASDPGVRLAGVALLEGVDSAIPRIGDERASWLVRYHCSPEGDLTAVRDRTGTVVRQFQWQKHILIGHGIPGGLEVRYDWDQLSPEGKVQRQSEAEGLTRDYAYAADHTIVTDSLGRVETYHFEGDGPDTRWTAHTRADGSRIEHQYDGFGRKVADIDPLGRTTRMQRDGEGRIIGRSLPDGSRWQYRLDPESGEPLAIEGPGGFKLTIERDARANPVAITQQDGTTTRYTYDDPALPDRPTTRTDPRGGVRRLQWNRLGQLVAHTDCSGHTSRFGYDDEGRLVAESNALNETTRYRHDASGRLVERTDPAGHTTGYSYDSVGRLIARLRPDGKIEALAWDRFGRLTSHKDAGGLTQRFRYDLAGRLIALINENEAVSRFEYDPLDRLLTETGFDSRLQRYTYNAAGELLTRTEASLPDAPVTRYEHDALGRLSARHLPATAHAPASTETFRWRADGQLAGFANAQAEISLGFDVAGRPAFETQTHADGWTYHVAHAYDLLGRAAATTLGNAPALQWLSYGAGHLHGVRIGSAAIDFTRDSLYRETERIARGATGDTPILTAARRYTALGQLAASRTEPAAGVPRQSDYQHNALGLITTIQDSAVSAIAYTYDRSAHLVGSRHGEHTHRYRFDAAGNRLDPAPDPKRRPNAEEWTRIVQERLHDPNFNPLEEYGLDGGTQHRRDNRISALAGTRNRYDGAGNLIEQLRPDGTRLELRYDGAHRLVHLSRTDPDGHITHAEYRYDALSRRIAKSVTDRTGSTTTTRYGWDGERLVCEDDGTTRNTVFHTPGSFVPLLRVEQASDNGDDEETHETQRLLSEVAGLFGTHGLAVPDALKPEPKAAHIRFYHTDHLGTPLQLIDTTGKIRWQANPDDWRAVRDQQGARQPIRFQGQWEDEESGLYYNRYRYYDPAMGRYVTQDPIGLAGGLNTYGYVAGNPVSYTDSLGLNPGTAAGATLGTLVLPGPGTAVGAIIGSTIGAAIGWWIMNQDKTPNEGEPGSCHVNPGSGQERKYGSNGKPEYDIDWDHDHGQGTPHGHNWDGSSRDGGWPISPWPRNRTAGQNP